VLNESFTSHTELPALHLELDRRDCSESSCLDAGRPDIFSPSYPSSVSLRIKSLLGASAMGIECITYTLLFTLSSTAPLALLRISIVYAASPFDVRRMLLINSTDFE